MMGIKVPEICWASIQWHLVGFSSLRIVIKFDYCHLHNQVSYFQMASISNGVPPSPSLSPPPSLKAKSYFFSQVLPENSTAMLTSIILQPEKFLHILFPHFDFYFTCAFLLRILYKPVLIKSNEMQQYAGVYLLHNYSTCFGCLSHPSSGVHQTVTAASVTSRITCQNNNFPPVWPN